MAKSKPLLPQILKHFQDAILKDKGESTWEEFIKEDDEGFNDEEIWIPQYGGKFILGELIIIPSCSMLDGGCVLATWNLTELKKIIHQMTEVVVYEKTHQGGSAYFFYSGAIDDSDGKATVFEVP